jgi:hypothetical protein
VRGPGRGRGVRALGRWAVDRSPGEPCLSDDALSGRTGSKEGETADQDSPSFTIQSASSSRIARHKPRSGGTDLGLRST